MHAAGVADKTSVSGSHIGTGVNAMRRNTRSIVDKKSDTAS